jgi:hypothetical protein
MNRDEISQLLKIMFTYPSLEDPKMIDTLVVAGLSQSEAELAAILVPCALARPILENAGVAKIIYFAKNQQGEWVEVDLSQQFIYQEVVALARQKAWLSDPDFEGYQSIVGSTVEIRSLDKAYKAGADVKGANIKTYIQSVNAEQLGNNKKGS